uniref:Uncharacterized protein n=1 Tax=Rhizophora mucronata TaxID=61149 RepID=A0A2P2R219_RHIMU
MSLLRCLNTSLPALTVLVVSRVLYSKASMETRSYGMEHGRRNLVKTKSC